MVFGKNQKMIPDGRKFDESNNRSVTGYRLSVAIMYRDLGFWTLIC